MGETLNRSQKASIAALLLAAAVVLGACGAGSSTSGDYGGSHPNYRAALAGSPAPLARLHRRAGALLGGGTGAFRSRLAGLHGYPVVVNKWASWCEPCREEFPYFQKAAARHGTRVAFLGLDSEDSDAAARTFLREFPVPYPSYSDPDQAIAAGMKATLGFPATAFYDADGDLVHVKQGQYASRAELDRDIREFAG